ncbi:DUF7344 domain-containing protein [Halorarum halobium]|uniref:DUF7344 domain-containing protein n=1 Tax=Halorarum halobium TaxID=3075121 RepID=UPI0028A93856|nr:hypothetical protein [Halobaculum sp. XH14]
MNSSEPTTPERVGSADSSSPEEESAEEATEQRARDLPLDIIFEVLKNERRRLVLAYLRDAEGAVTIGELAEHIAAHENDITPAELNAQQRKRVYIGLYQCHLPKMDDADAVAFNQDRGIVELGRSADTLYQYLDSDSGVEDNARLRQYTMFSVVGGLAFVSAQFAGTPMLPELIVFAVLVGVPAVTYFSEGT